MNGSTPPAGAMGITDYAQSQLSDIVFVEILVEDGETVEAGKAIASVESVKASAEIYAPAAGKVTAVNKGLSDKPETLNSDPFGEGWMIKVEGGSRGRCDGCRRVRKVLRRARTLDQMQRLQSAVSSC